MLKVKVYLNIMDLGYEKEDQKDFDEIMGKEELNIIAERYMKQEYKNQEYEIDTKILTGNKKSKIIIDNCKKCGNDLFGFLENFLDFGHDEFWIGGL